MSGLCDFEIQVLKGLRDGGVQWGAATNAALEALEGSGLVCKTVGPDAIRYELSDAGREWLEDRHG